MRDVTLLFLVRKDPFGTITDICLAMKKRGFGKGRYNGYGGKLENDETIEDAVKRECREESGVLVSDLECYGDVEFSFAHSQNLNQRVNIYVSSLWGGVPVETEEMKPFWFKADAIPYNEMWPGDDLWFTHVLQGKKVKGAITFGEGDTVLKHQISIVD